MSILIYQKESGTLNKCFVAHLDTHKGYRLNISTYSIKNKFLIKIQFNNIYQEEIDLKHWLKKIISKSFISSIGYFDLAYLGISCQTISKDFGYRFIGT